MGEEGGEGYGGGGRKTLLIYLSLHCYHQNDSCIKMDSDESHFNQLIKRKGQSHSWDSDEWQTTTFEEKGEPKVDSNRGPSAYQPNALPLGQRLIFRLE